MFMYCTVTFPLLAETYFYFGKNVLYCFMPIIFFTQSPYS